MSKVLYLIWGAVLLGCAFLHLRLPLWPGSGYEIDVTLLLMLFLPFLDRGWRWSSNAYTYRSIVWLTLVGCMFALLMLDRVSLTMIVGTLLITALPEEWFFRGYFMQRVMQHTQGRWLPNIATSVLFVMMHIPSQGLAGLSVFVPSLILGYVYQMRRDLVSVVLLHAIANITYLSVLGPFVSRQFESASALW